MTNLQQKKPLLHRGKIFFLLSIKRWSHGDLILASYLVRYKIMRRAWFFVISEGFFCNLGSTSIRPSLVSTCIDDKLFCGVWGWCRKVEKYRERNWKGALIQNLSFQFQNCWLFIDFQRNLRKLANINSLQIPRKDFPPILTRFAKN